MKRRQSYLSSLDMFYLIPWYLEFLRARATLLPTVLLRKLFTVISTMPSSSTPQHLSLHSFPWQHFLPCCIFAAQFFQVAPSTFFFEDYPLWRHFPEDSFQAFRIILSLPDALPRILCFFQHSFAALGYFWQGGWIQCSCCMTLWYCFRCSQHHLTIYPILDRKVSMKIVGSISLSLSLSPLFWSNCIKQLVPYVFTTFSCDQLLTIFLSLVPHSACSTPFPSAG